MSWISKLFGISNGFMVIDEPGTYSIDYDGIISPVLELALKRNSPTLSAIIRKHRKDIKKVNFGKDTGKGIIYVSDDIKYKKYNLNDLCADFVEDLDLDGNIYLEKIGSENYRRIRPADIQWVNNDNITIQRNGGKQTSYTRDRASDYFTTTQGGITGTLYTKRLLDIINLDTGRGESPMLSIKQAIYMNIYATMHNESYLKRGMKSDMLITFEEKLNEKEFENFKAEFNRKHSGASNAGKPLILGGVKTQVQNLQGAVRDMDFKTLVDTADEQIAKVYDMPLPLISKTVQSYNNYSTAVSSYYRDCILPTSEFLISFLNEIFQENFKIDETSIPALQEEKIRISKDMATAGIYSINECREVSGYGEIVGGEQIFRPASDIPIGDDVGVSDE